MTETKLIHNKMLNTVVIMIINKIQSKSSLLPWCYLHHSYRPSADCWVSLLWSYSTSQPSYG